ncbi:MAG: DUF4365 domain-containing protein [Bryobacteraceae bacterium]
MNSPKQDATSEQGVAWVKHAVSRHTGWIFREQTNMDKGVDAQVEEVADGRATGRLIGLQIKSGQSWFKGKTRGGYTYNGDAKHLTYWHTASRF